MLNMNMSNCRLRSMSDKVTYWLSTARSASLGKWSDCEM